MLFSKTIEPKCVYCRRAQTSSDPETVLCPKRGVMARDASCGSFRYDPLKRVPTRPISLDLSKLNEEDFTL